MYEGKGINRRGGMWTKGGGVTCSSSIQVVHGKRVRVYVRGVG